MKCAAAVALSKGTADAPPVRNELSPLGCRCTTTNDCDAAGSTGGLAPAAATVVFKSKNKKPVFFAGRGNEAPLVNVRWVAVER